MWGSISQQVAHHCEDPQQEDGEWIYIAHRPERGGGGGGGGREKGRGREREREREGEHKCPGFAGILWLLSYSVDVGV